MYKRIFSLILIFVIFVTAVGCKADLESGEAVENNAQINEEAQEETSAAADELPKKPLDETLFSYEKLSVPSELYTNEMRLFYQDDKCIIFEKTVRIDMGSNNWKQSRRRW